VGCGPDLKPGDKGQGKRLRENLGRRKSAEFTSLSKRKKKDNTLGGDRRRADSCRKKKTGKLIFTGKKS